MSRAKLVADQGFKYIGIQRFWLFKDNIVYNLNEKVIAKHLSQPVMNQDEILVLEYE